MENNDKAGPSKNAPTPSVPANKSKTQVLVLRPDVLKKLGISSEIPNLSQIQKKDVVGETTSLQTKKLEQDMREHLTLKLNQVFKMHLDKIHKTKVMQPPLQSCSKQDIKTTENKLVSTPNTISCSEKSSSSVNKININKPVTINKNKNPLIVKKITPNLIKSKKTTLSEPVKIKHLDATSETNKTEENLNIKQIIRNKIESKINLNNSETSTLESKKSETNNTTELVKTIIIQKQHQTEKEILTTQPDNLIKEIHNNQVEISPVTKATPSLKNEEETKFKGFEISEINRTQSQLIKFSTIPLIKKSKTFENKNPKKEEVAPPKQIRKKRTQPHEPKKSPVFTTPQQKRRNKVKLNLISENQSSESESSSSASPVRKSGRKRKVSSLLEDYITDFDNDLLLCKKVTAAKKSTETKNTSSLSEQERITTNTQRKGLISSVQPPKQSILEETIKPSENQINANITKNEIKEDTPSTNVPIPEILQPPHTPESQNVATPQTPTTSKSCIDNPVQIAISLKSPQDTEEIKNSLQYLFKTPEKSEQSNKSQLETQNSPDLLNIEESITAIKIPKNQRPVDINDEFSTSVLRRQNSDVKTYIRRHILKPNINVTRRLDRKPEVLKAEEIELKDIATTSKVNEIQSLSPAPSVISRNNLILQRPSSNKHQDNSNVTPTLKQEKSNKPIINIIENKLITAPIIIPVVQKPILTLNEEILADIPIILVDNLPNNLNNFNILNCGQQNSIYTSTIIKNSINQNAMLNKNNPDNIVKETRDNVLDINVSNDNGLTTGNATEALISEENKFEIVAGKEITDTNFEDNTTTNLENQSSNNVIEPLQTLATIALKQPYASSEILESEPVEEISENLNTNTSEMLEPKSSEEIQKNLNTNQSEILEAEPIEPMSENLNTNLSEILEPEPAKKNSENRNTNISELLESKSTEEIPENLNKSKSPKEVLENLNVNNPENLEPETKKSPEQIENTEEIPENLNTNLEQQHSSEPPKEELKIFEEVPNDNTTSIDTTRKEEIQETLPPLNIIKQNSAKTNSTDMNLNMETSYSEKLADLRVAEILAPRRRGRPLGTKNRVRVPFPVKRNMLINQNKTQIGYLKEDDEKIEATVLKEEIQDPKIEVRKSKHNDIEKSDRPIEYKEIEEDKNVQIEEKQDKTVENVSSEEFTVEEIENKRSKGRLVKSTKKEQIETTPKRKIGRSKKIKNETAEPTTPHVIEEEIKDERSKKIKKETPEPTTPHVIEEESKIDKTPKKRGRPRKSLNIIKSDDKEQLDDEIFEHRSKRRRIRTIIESDEENQVEEELNEITASSKRCARRKNPIKLAYSSSEEEELKEDNEVSVEEIEETQTMVEESVVPEEKSSKRVRKKKFNDTTHKDNKKQYLSLAECAICHATFPNNEWNMHRAKHNFLCWRVGEKEIDLNDKKLCETILWNVTLVKKLALTCPDCGEKRKSTAGYLSHREICQKTEEERLAMRVQCPECDARLMPSSLKIHMRNHIHSRTSKTQSEKNSAVIREVYDEGGKRLQRNAAKRAQGLINKVTSEETETTINENEIKRYYKKGNEPKKFFSERTFVLKYQIKFKFNKKMSCPIKGCNFASAILKEMKTHIEDCSKLSENDYICFSCFFITKEETEIRKHVINEHMNTVDKDNDFKDLEDQDSSSSESADIEDVTENLKEIIIDTKEKNKMPKKIYRSAKTNNSWNKVSFLNREERIVNSIICAYPPAGKWTLKFCEDNYTFEYPFKHFSISSLNWSPIPVEDHDMYLPNIKQSMSVKTLLISKEIPKLQGQDHTWKEFELFESECNKDAITIFCGAPIWALAWVPTPYNLKVDQILAVSVQKDFESKLKASQAYSSEEVIQFWNFGPITFSKILKTPPTLEFCLVHNHGVVWCMEWCPSGCYDVKPKSESDCSRIMGMLALACSDGTIPIYSICFPNSLPQKGEGLNMYKAKECFKLLMQDESETKLGNWNYQCTKIFWSKAKGHNIFAAGYTNGVVCLWDLGTESPLLKSEEDGVIILKPYFSFQPHTATITALYLYLWDNGKRWLVTGSCDRNNYCWDLKNYNVSMCVFAKRGNVSDGALINHWVSSITSYDDVHLLEHTTTLIQNPRDFGFRTCSLLAANSMVMGLSANDWGNCVAQGSLAGELTCTFPRQLLMYFDGEKGPKYKRLLVSYCESIEKDLNPELREEKLKLKDQIKSKTNFIPEQNDNKSFNQYLNTKDNIPYDAEPDTYEEAKKKYGIIFCDINMREPDEIPAETLYTVKQSLRMRDVPVELYPFMSHNRVAWNPNKQGYIYVASGYQSGFVRLRCVRMMHHLKVSEIKL